MHQESAVVAEPERTNYAVSADGTRIGWTSYGKGPPLVLVSGVSADRTQWQGVIPTLASHITVCAVDRRGRGLSGEGPVYALPREFEDIAAVAAAVGEGVAVLGHSHGGCCALGAAILTEKIGRLIVYEGWPPRPVRPSEPETLRALDDLLEEERREELLIQFFREIVGLPAQQLEATRANPAWPGRLKAAHTIARELRATRGFDFADDALRTLRAATLLLAGGENLAWLQPSIDRLTALIPNLQVAVMPGQGHIAMNSAPALFCNEVTAFLTHEQNVRS